MRPLQSFPLSFFLSQKFGVKCVDEGKITMVRRLTLNNSFDTKFSCFAFPGGRDTTVFF